MTSTAAKRSNKKKAYFYYTAISEKSSEEGVYACLQDTNIKNARERFSIALGREIKAVWRE